MAHLHEMRDSDSHYIVDPVSRTVKSNGSSKSILIQYDHNSEILTFEMPRYIEGHDMKLCNRVDIHYINMSGQGQSNLGVYEVQDFAVSEDDENTVIWSWTISNNATQLVGSLAFAFRFACIREMDPSDPDAEPYDDYVWSTSPYAGIAISSGIYNAEYIIEQYIDILEQWVRKIGVSVEDVNQDVESTESEGINTITLILTDGRRESFYVRNGRTPVRGVDYWTEADKTEIINDILNVLPEAEGASF